MADKCLLCEEYKKEMIKLDKELEKSRDSSRKVNKILTELLKYLKENDDNKQDTV
jgi:hypothetical protein